MANSSSTRTAALLSLFFLWTGTHCCSFFAEAWPVLPVSRTEPSSRLFLSFFEKNIDDDAKKDSNRKNSSNNNHNNNHNHNQDPQYNPIRKRRPGHIGSKRNSLNASDYGFSNRIDSSQPRPNASTNHRHRRTVATNQPRFFTDQEGTGGRVRRGRPPMQRQRRRQAGPRRRSAMEFGMEDLRRPGQQWQPPMPQGTIPTPSRGDRGGSRGRNRYHPGSSRPGRTAPSTQSPFSRAYSSFSSTTTTRRAYSSFSSTTTTRRRTSRQPSGEPFVYFSTTTASSTHRPRSRPYQRRPLTENPGMYSRSSSRPEMFDPVYDALQQRRRQQQHEQQRRREQVEQSTSSPVTNADQSGGKNQTAASETDANSEFQSVLDQAAIVLRKHLDLGVNEHIAVGPIISQSSSFATTASFGVDSFYANNANQRMMVRTLEARLDGCHSPWITATLTVDENDELSEIRLRSNDGRSDRVPIQSSRGRSGMNSGVANGATDSDINRSGSGASNQNSIDRSFIDVEIIDDDEDEEDYDYDYDYDCDEDQDDGEDESWNDGEGEESCGDVDDMDESWNSEHGRSWDSDGYEASWGDDGDNGDAPWNPGEGGASWGEEAWKSDIDRE